MSAGSEPYVVTDAELADLIERCDVDAASYARQAESSPCPQVEEEWARVARLERDALRELARRRIQDVTGYGRHEGLPGTLVEYFYNSGPGAAVCCSGSARRGTGLDEPPAKCEHGNQIHWCT